MSIILTLSNGAPETHGCGIVQFDKRSTGLHAGYQICDVLRQLSIGGENYKNPDHASWFDSGAVTIPISQSHALHNFSLHRITSGLSLFYNMPFWTQNRSAGVVTGKILSLRDFWLEIWIHFFSLPCRPHASSTLHSIWSTPIITICWKATCRLLSLPPWPACSETGCSLNVTICFPFTESRRQNQTSLLYILDSRRRDMWLWPHRYQTFPRFNVLLISPLI